MTASPVLDVLEELIASVVDPAAADVDALQDFIGRALCGMPLFG